MNQNYHWHSPTIDKLEDAMRKKKYELLFEEYPDYISLDQMYQICGIAKRSALYLIRNGIVPAIDTGKKTWRYKIAINDVITYLRQKEQWGSMIPPGMVSSRTTGSAGGPEPPRKSYAEFIGDASEQDLKDYFDFIYADCPDMLTSAETVEMTGLNTKAIARLIKLGQVQAVRYRSKNLITKRSLLAYVSSKEYYESRCNSPHFHKVLAAFEIWLKSQRGEL